MANAVIKLGSSKASLKNIGDLISQTILHPVSTIPQVFKNPVEAAKKATADIKAGGIKGTLKSGVTAAVVTVATPYAVASAATAAAAYPIYAAGIGLTAAGATITAPTLVTSTIAGTPRLLVESGSLLASSFGGLSDKEKRDYTTIAAKAGIFGIGAAALGAGLLYIEDKISTPTTPTAPDLPTAAPDLPKEPDKDKKDKDNKAKDIIIPSNTPVPVITPSGTGSTELPVTAAAPTTPQTVFMDEKPITPVEKTAQEGTGTKINQKVNITMTQNAANKKYINKYHHRKRWEA